MIVLTRKSTVEIEADIDRMDRMQKLMRHARDCQTCLYVSDEMQFVHLCDFGLRLFNGRSEHGQAVDRFADPGRSGA